MGANDSPTTWTRLTVECPPAAVEAVSALLLEACPSGLAIEEAGGLARVSGYLSSAAIGPDTEAVLLRVRKALARIPPALAPQPPHASAQAVPDRDWIESFRQHCRPVRVGRLVIKPTWHRWPDPEFPSRPDDALLDLDPGMAFGTGTHATTRLCLAALGDLVVRGHRILDLGCGSGVLSIAAVRLGASEVAAVDCDPVAVRATCANAALNGVTAALRVICADTLGAFRPGWDLVVANIAPAVITGQALLAYDLLRPSGRYLASGIPVARTAEVESALREAGFGELETTVLEEWSCVVGRRPEEGRQ